VIQMTWIGAPSIYYGDEAGLCGWTDPDNRRTYPWGSEDKELIAVHKTLISIRNALPALKTGSLKCLYGEYNIIAYGRWNSEDKVVIVVNNNDTEKVALIPVWEIGITHGDTCQQVMETTTETYTTVGEIYDVVRGKLRVELKPYSAKIIKARSYKTER